MKRKVLSYDQLGSKLQTKAVEYFLTQLLKDILEHGVRFNDELNDDDLQARIDKATAKADKMQTPWFAHEYILETCRQDLTGMAQCSAEDTEYHVSANGKRLFILELQPIAELEG